MFKFILAFTLLLAFSSSTLGIFSEDFNCTLYVSTKGDDSNNGLTEAKPFKTFNRAIVQVQRNESSWKLAKTYVCVAAGDYDLSGNNTLEATSKGEATNLTFIALPHATLKNVNLTEYERNYLGFMNFDIYDLLHNETNNLGSELLGKSKYKSTPLFEIVNATLYKDVLVGYGDHSYSFSFCTFAGLSKP